MGKRRRTEVLGVKRIKEILRLKELGLNQSEIAKSVNVSRSTVQEYLARAAAAGISGAEAQALDEEELRHRLSKQSRASKKKAEFDHHYIARELTKKGVTKLLLWQEHLEQNPDSGSYRSFCQHHRDWRSANQLSMRQEHKAGEKLFVDYAGQTIGIYDRETQKVLYQAQIFVAVFGASNYTYVEATPSQSQKHWIGSHRRTFEFFQGVPRVLVPDNLKSAVKSPCYYDPEINPAYQSFAQHYDVAVVPARVRKPKDKAKAEVGVQIVERLILAPLRNRRFYSLRELNQEIQRLLEILNNREMKTYRCSRKQLFESIDKPCLAPLPQTPFELIEAKIARVNIDYHVEVDQHYYSVPHQLVRKQVEVRIKEQTVEVLYQGKRVAIHAKSQEKFKHSTNKQHMSPSHQAAAQQWTPERFLNWSAKIGPETKAQVESLLGSRKHPEQSYRSILGLLRLADKFGVSRLEQSCKKANLLGIVSMKRIKSMLESGVDLLPIVQTKEVPAVSHGSVRGEDYYH